MEREPGKSELRLRYLNRRRGIPVDDHIRMSEALCRHLAHWIQHRQYRRVFAFSPFRGEPDVTSLVHRASTADFYLPVIGGAEERSMHFFAWKRGDALSPNRYGIHEPERAAATEAAPPDEHTVILVPGVLMDRDGYRLGYGGGYYDRFLHEAHTCGAVSVGVIFEEFLIASLPAEAHDIQLQHLATERGVRKASV